MEDIKEDEDIDDDDIENTKELNVSISNTVKYIILYNNYKNIYNLYSKIKFNNFIEQYQK